MTKPVRIKSWWRVETDAKGKIVSARAVEAAGTDAGGVFFVRAKDEADAGRRAFMAYQLEATRARRRRYLAEGRCQYCGRENDRGGTLRCSICLKGHKVHKERRNARDRGEEVPPPDWRAAHQARRAQEDAALCLEKLREVNRKLLALGKDAGMRWLRGEIERLAAASEGKKVA